MREESRGESSSSQIFRWLWRRTWKLSILGKIKHFIWRAYHVSLPTSHNLFRRKITPNPFCKICDQEEESTTHALWKCAMARNTWALVSGRVQKLPNQRDDFTRFMLWIFQNFSNEEVEDWATTSWAIWSARNCYIFETHQKSRQHIRREALLLLREYCQANTPNRSLKNHVFVYLYGRSCYSASFFSLHLLCVSITYFSFNEYGLTRACLEVSCPLLCW